MILRKVEASWKLLQQKHGDSIMMPFLFQMEYKTNFYEALTRRMYVSWSVTLSCLFSDGDILNALRCVHAKHPYLRCKIREEANIGEITLVDNGSIDPVISFISDAVNETTICEYLEKCSDVFYNTLSIDDTVHYSVVSDIEKGKCAIIANFCHSCVDANSSIRVATDFLKYLDNPSLTLPESRPFISVQNEILLKDEEPGHVRFANQKEEIWIAPSRLHEDDPSIPSYFRTKKILIGEPDLLHILDACRSHECTYQSYLWACMAICLMKMFSRSFPATIRFGTPATTVGRALFSHAITKEDLVVGAYSVFVQSTLQEQESFWTLCGDLQRILKDEISRGEQMNDFFGVCRDLDFGKLPTASFNGCTLGMTELSAQYNHFDLESMFFIPGATRRPGMGGLNVHSFSVSGMGCMVHCTYIYPGFSTEDMIGYTENLKKMMLMMCEEDYIIGRVFSEFIEE